MCTDVDMDYRDSCHNWLLTYQMDGFDKKWDAGAESFIYSKIVVLVVISMGFVK